MDKFENGLPKMAIQPVIQHNLRLPVQIVKKRSGPLDDILAEFNTIETGNLNSIESPTVKEFFKQSKTSNIVKQSPIQTRRRQTLKDKDKKRERWLLTRKTWKYMTDAGRKLIPEGIQNRQEDILKIEENFQKVCALEPHFVLWRRKYSYPGAIRNSKKRLKQLLQHTGQKTLQALEREEIDNADTLLELLHSHLKLDESIKTDTLLGTKTEDPHQTDSPSAQRPKPLMRAARKREDMSFSLRGPGFLPLCDAYQSQQQHQIETDQLLQRLFILSRSTALPNIINVPTEQINFTLLNDNVALKKIYNSLKKQQLHRTLSKHSMPSQVHNHLTHSKSMLSLLNFSNSHASTNSEASQIITSKSYNTDTLSDTVKTGTITPTLTSSTDVSSGTKALERQQLKNTISSTYNPPTAPHRQRQRNPPTSLNLSDNSNTSSSLKKDQKHRHRQTEPIKHFNSCSTQTSFIPLCEIKRLSEEYKDMKREELVNEGLRDGGNTTTDDEGEKQVPTHLNRRKSSIDNEDIPPSVSNTIKRYLRMARKKSVHDDNANRFKRVNYDRNLRNIHAKGEINPPGIDENSNKAAQTLDAWAVIALDFIRGDINSDVLENAHKDWQKSLDDRIRRKLEYEQKLLGSLPIQLTGVSPFSMTSSSSAPTSPTSNHPNRTTLPSHSPSNDTGPILDSNATSVFRNSTGENSGHISGIFHSGSQFIANLWHSNTSSSSLSSPTTNEPQQQKHEPVDIKKSKSLSHIGHYVSTKFLKSQSKNQPLSINSSNISAATIWSREGKCSWKSETGKHILLRDTSFHILSELEIKMVKDVCIERIVELDIGINLNDLSEGKSHKRHPLTKMRAMTTSFFDIGKKDPSNHNLSLFGNSLEACVIIDKKLEMANLAAFSDTQSQNSIVSLFWSNRRSCQNTKNTITSDKLNENVRSCENLLTQTDTQFCRAPNTSKPMLEVSYFGNISKYKNVSRSQSDCSPYSRDNLEYAHLFPNNVIDIQMYKKLKVPKFVKCCIKFLEENGLHKVGIFRVSTSKKKVKQLRDCLHNNIDNCFDRDTCPHNVATLLKEFLRDLPEPLLSNRLYKAFLQTQKIRNRRLQLEALSHLVKLLPPTHLDTLYILLKFLAKIAACSDDICDSDGTLRLTGNKMDSNNLATVFAPNILRLSDHYKSPSSTDNMQSSCKQQQSIDDAINVVRIMIDHYEELFLVPAEVLDVVFSYLVDAAPGELNNLCEYHKSPKGNSIHFY